MVMLLELLGKRNLISQDLQLHPVQQFRGRFSSGSYFLSLWIGANDVLGYAVAGGIGKIKRQP
jgi:hypothetical protein